VCDGFFYKGQEVVIVGGGDTAAEEATYLSKLCPKVTMLVRKDSLRASKAMQNRVLNTPNIEVRWNTETLELLGGKSVEGVKVRNLQTGVEDVIPASGFFVAIGHKPNTDIFKGQLTMDETGYLKTIVGTTSMNLPGVFAAGDVIDDCGPCRNGSTSRFTVHGVHADFGAEVGLAEQAWASPPCNLRSPLVHVRPSPGPGRGGTQATRPIALVSLFDGLGTARLALQDLLEELGHPGALAWAGFAELDPLLAAAVARHWRAGASLGAWLPYHRMAGDVWDLLRHDGGRFGTLCEQLPSGALVLLVGGSPCQDLTTIGPH
jgi:hypothetical protein